MEIIAYIMCSLAALTAVFSAWRGGQAATDRDNQPADSNDVVVAIAFAAGSIVLAVAGVMFAVLA